MVLRPPNSMQVLAYQLDQWVKGLEVQGKVYTFLIGIGRVLQTSVTPLLFILDYVKDIVLYLILRTTLQRLEDTCKPLTALGIECLTASGAEEDLLTALLVSFSVSLINQHQCFLLEDQIFQDKLLPKHTFCSHFTTVASNIPHQIVPNESIL